MSESLMEAQRLTRSHVTPSMVNRLNNKDINTKIERLHEIYLEERRRN